MNSHLKAVCSLLLGICLLSWNADAACPDATGGNNSCTSSQSIGGWQFYNSSGVSLVGGDPTNATTGYGVYGVVASTNNSAAVYGASGTASYSVGVEGNCST